MKKKCFIIILSSFALLLLSGCDQVGDLLDKANQLLDSQLSEEDDTIQDSIEDEHEDTSEDQNDLTDDSIETIADDDQTVEGEPDVNVSSTDYNQPFDERLLSQGYEVNYVPNGLYIDVPYHWLLVEENLVDPTAKNYEAMFCFDLPLEIEDVAQQFGTHYENISHQRHGEGNDIIHTTQFSQDYGFEKWEGTLEYFLDSYGNTCVNLAVLIDYEDGEGYGEDPATMVSEEELAEMNETAQIDPERIQSLPDDYEQTLSLVRDNEDLFDQSNVVSITEKINQGEIDLIHVSNGFPRIFPYEWYLVNELDMPTYSSWSGTFLTDTSMNQAIVKHLDMLENHQADILYFATEGIVKPNVLAEIAFAFNDDYGTGSWQGTSIFFISPEGEGTYPNHVGITVELEFSDELLD